MYTRIVRKSVGAARDEKINKKVYGGFQHDVDNHTDSKSLEGATVAEW